MSRPIRTDQIEDAFVRGAVEMFMQAVELHNEKPSEITASAISTLYKTVQEYCTLSAKLTVKIKGEEMTE